MRFWALLLSCVSCYAAPIQAGEESSHVQREKYRAAIQRLESNAAENRGLCGGKYGSMSELEQGACLKKVLDFCHPRCAALPEHESAGCLFECASKVYPEDYPNINGLKAQARDAYKKAYAKGLDDEKR